MKQNRDKRTKRDRLLRPGIPQRTGLRSGGVFGGGKNKSHLGNNKY